jgi:acetyl-CoA C-acetyltransferase
MAKQVAICAVAQTTQTRSKWDQRFQGMALEVLEKLREQVEVKFARHVKGASGINMTISVSDDVFDARTISNNAMTDVLGAHFGCEEKVAQEGIQALYYALTAIQSGHNDMVLVLGHCKESQGKSRNMVTHLAFDPFYTRPVGLDFCAAAGLQAQAYQEKSGITDEQLAKVVVRAREKAAKNPNTPETAPLTLEDVMKSDMLADPIRALHAYPVTDGAVGMVLAVEDVAKKISKNPVWLTGAGNCMDSFFLGDRDLTSNFSLKKAVQLACKRAGITDPRKAFDVIELSDQYAYQLPLWAEGLDLCDEGNGGKWIDAGGPEKDHVNFSGGMLAGNPLMIGGLVRAAEAVLQLRGEAGGNQINGAKTALAHGVMGPAGQFHSVITLKRN